MRIFFKAAILLVVCISFSCKKNNDPVANTNTDAARQAVVNNYADIVYATYSDAYDQARVLQAAINTFVAAPSADGFSQTKNAWLTARIPYLQSEAFRFYGGPIDENGSERLLNAWPMNEAFVDYVVGDLNAGIINDTVTYPTIDLALIESLNEKGGATNIATGYHAIEFLLWGQDTSANYAGNRPYKDYVVGDSGTAKHQERRAQYLVAAAELLVNNLANLAKAWEPGQNNYRKAFLEAPVNESLQKMLLGMGRLAGGELAGKRMEVAYNTKDQEDEQSSFSDNTHIDIIFNAKGIENVYYGRYASINGTVINGSGIDDLVLFANATVNSQMALDLTLTKRAVEAINPPFDQEIITAGGRVRVLTTIESLKVEVDKIVEVAQSLGLSLVL